jgi:nucleotide-binding universal stress UspA family protein
VSTASTTSRPSGAVVVGVAAENTTSAIRWAVDEARTRQLPLHLVHAFGTPGAILTNETHGRVFDRAEHALNQAIDHARGLAHGTVQVSAELDGEHEPVDALVKLSRDAGIVVLQHRMLGPVHRAFSGSMVNAVAARAHSPVVSVGESWRPREPHGVVTVAVQEPDDALDMLTAAGEEAAARGASVNVLHAWWLSSGYDVVVVDDAYRKERELEAHEWLDPVLAEYERLQPGTTVTTQIRHAPPLEAILDAAATSDMLVIGRRRRVLPQGSHLGPVSRAVLDHTDTPVLVIGKPSAEHA